MPDTQDKQQDSGSPQPKIDNKETWKIALERIQLQVSPQNFTAWFKNTSLAPIQNGIATVECPNSFTREWLDTNHHKLITSIIRTITKQDLDVVFAVRPPTPENTSENPFSQEQPQAEASKPAHAQSAAQAPQTTASPDTRYDNLSISPEEAPIFNVEYTHQTLVQTAQERAFLNPNYQFENFVVGSSNRLAHAAAEAVAENPGRSYNPFFIYGGTGLGKTHLSQSIGNRIINEDPNKKVLYCPSETFLNEMVESIRNDKASEFRNNYRKLDVLILDDIQFISNWEGAQTELFHTFNTLYQAGKEIILLADRPPREIDNLADRLRSRFEGGMVADIHEPDYELRVAILRQKAQEKNITLPENIILFIAQSVEDNIRELEGALMKISTHMKFGGNTPDEKEVALILKLDPESKRKKNSPKDVITGVCKTFGVTTRDVRGKRRTAEVVIPRQVCMYVLRKDLELPLEQIARELNRSDHTTVMHAIERVEEKMDEDDNFKERVREVRV